jgi:NAD(P)-dependent dehydrogenase (short-subunit alcohol dehydrogenase family)
MKLKGKVALITGGTSGIGAASALLFAKEGAKVSVVSRGNAGKAVVEKINALGGEAIFIKTDVSKSDEIKKMVKCTKRRLEGWISFSTMPRTKVLEHQSGNIGRRAGSCH